MGKIKEHVKKHKKLYIGISITVIATTLAIITYAIVRSPTAQGGVGGTNAQGGLGNTASFILNNKQVINVTTVLDREGRGHPGWPVRNIETKKIFFSQREAAAAFGVSEGLVSGHLNGKFPDVDGLHFERISLSE